MLFLLIKQTLLIMPIPVITIPKKNLLSLGLSNTENIHYQLSPQELVQDTLRMGDGVLNDTGALIIRTGEFTGRSPKDKFIVKDNKTVDTLHWNEFNIPINESYFDIIRKKITNYLNNRKELWVRDCYACADPRYRLNIRVINEKPWNNLFAYNMFLRPTEEELEDFKPEWHILSARVFSVIDASSKLILLLPGKKIVFSTNAPGLMARNISGSFSSVRLIVLA